MWGDAHDIHGDTKCVYQPKSSCGHFNNHPKEEYQADLDVAGIKATGDDLLLQKGKRVKKNRNQRNQSVADLSIQITFQKKVKLPWCSPAAYPLGIRLRWSHLRSAC